MDRVDGAWVDYQRMINPNNPRVPIRMPLGSFVRKNNDIGMGTWIERILLTSSVVCGVVDAQNFVLVNLMFYELDGGTVLL